MPTLTWIGKDKVEKHADAVQFHVLKHKYSFDGDGQSDEDKGSENKIIHGDNLLALKSLLPEYEGKVKCIYIDPPYNTGNENWIYNDNVNDPKIKKWLHQIVGKDDLSRHDKWLCMMYPRLKLLKRLLSDDGAIFISIDDNEQANLRLMCDEIFGNQNFVNNIIWEKKFSPQNDSKYLSDSHDFIVIYAKNKNIWRPNLLPRTNEMNARYKNPDNDPRGVWTSSDFSAKTYSEKTDYPITTPSGRIVRPAKSRSWISSKEEFEKLVADNRIWFGENGNNLPRKKTFLSEVQSGLVSKTIWFINEVGDNQESKREIKSFSLQENFDTPKPTRLIERVLQLATEKNSIVLDSFAGSGTTAHAILKLNQEDGGNRKFILVEMEDYANTITAERVKRVIKGYGDTPGTGGSFNYYEIGEPVLIDDNLNEAVDTEEIRAYIWYTETKTAYKKPLSNSPAYLGEHNGTTYYFHYIKGQVTTLDIEFLRSIDPSTKNLLIYADECTLDDEYLSRNSIIFKKIPRDVKRL